MGFGGGHARRAPTAPAVGAWRATYMLSGGPRVMYRQLRPIPSSPNHFTSGSKSRIGGTKSWRTGKKGSRRPATQVVPILSEAHPAVIAAIFDPVSSMRSRVTPLIPPVSRGSVASTHTASPPSVRLLREQLQRVIKIRRPRREVEARVEARSACIPTAMPVAPVHAQPKLWPHQPRALMVWPRSLHAGE